MSGKCMIGDGHPSGAPHPAYSGNVSELKRPETAGSEPLDIDIAKSKALTALQAYFNRSEPMPNWDGNSVTLPDEVTVSIPIIRSPEQPSKRTFDTGATRDLDDGKLDYEGFLSPQVLQAFAQYMHGHRFMKDGSVRDSDNWQKGFPAGVAEKSLSRHYLDFWIMDRQGVDSYKRPDGEEVTILDALMGILFNVQALALQRLRSAESL